MGKGKFQISPSKVHLIQWSRRHQSQSVATMQCSLYRAPTIIMHLFPLLSYRAFLVVKKHTQTLKWTNSEYFNTHTIPKYSLLHSQWLCYCSIWQSPVVRICNGKIWRNWRNPHLILTSTWTNSIFHIPCSTGWSNSCSEPHLVFAYSYVWNWKNLQIDLGRKQSCITAGC
jgi:hypothetical protein